MTKAKHAKSKIEACGELAPEATPPPIKLNRAQTLIALMRGDDGVTANALAEAVGWQVHSVRGFIAGTLKKRADLTVIATRQDGVTRYRVTETSAS